MFFFRFAYIVISCFANSTFYFAKIMVQNPLVLCFYQIEQRWRFFSSLSTSIFSNYYQHSFCLLSRNIFVEAFLYFMSSVFKTIGYKIYLQKFWLFGLKIFCLLD